MSKFVDVSLKSLIRELTPPIVVKALRPKPKPGVTAETIYVSASATIAAAQAAGLSASDYVLQLWGGRKLSRIGELFEKLHSLGVIPPTLKAIVEIGPGTGVYTEQTLKYCRPLRYQIYETDREWSKWLAKTYPVEDCHADGQSLGSTESNSADLIHAYGVFVYLPLMVSLRYFKEIARVAAPGAFVVFDIISESCLDARTAEAWLDSGHYYPCFLSTAYVRNLFENKGFYFVDSFPWPFAIANGRCEYLIFQKRANCL